MRASGTSRCPGHTGGPGGAGDPGDPGDPGGAGVCGPVGTGDSQPSGCRAAGRAGGDPTTAAGITATAGSATGTGRAAADAGSPADRSAAGNLADRSAAGNPTSTGTAGRRPPGSDWRRSHQVPSAVLADTRATPAAASSR